VPDAVAALLKLYETDRVEGEATAAFFERVDPKRVLAALGDVLTPPPRGDEAADIGETQGFEVKTGVGECAA
jgi:hypothetical protein